MFPVLQIGPLSIQTPNLVILLGLWLGLTLAERLAPRFGVDGDTLYNLSFIAIIAGIIGARLSFAAQSLQNFLDKPLSLLSPTPNMLDPVGGMLIALTASLIYGSRKKLALWPTLDALTPLLATLGIALGLAHLASGDAFGMPAELLWGISLWGARRHPSQIYEIVASGLTLWLIWPRANSARGMAGETFGRFTALSAGACLFLHGFRGDSTILANGFRLEQIIAWGVLAVSLWWLGKFYKKIEG
ncbi:MAG: hypothetical protein DRI56_00885 [Chloroflexota bacterium]|nr:MAG: hypothetical protein B6243_06060 [Anaerolineaceae bacterium 4572_5.2]RLD11518.1 MAG: hypothetical protein DRI56_00885 [Chloroflexota bacterium]